MFYIRYTFIKKKYHTRLDLADQKTDSNIVYKLSIFLGINVISETKDDSEQINVLVSKSVAQVKSTYPVFHVGLVIIIPCKCKSSQIIIINQSATNINIVMRKWCAHEDKKDCVDFEKLFYRNVTIIRSMSDKSDYRVY